MPKIIQQAWLSFGRLLDFSPQLSNTSVQIREWGRELAKRGDGNALAGDYRRVGHDIKLAMSKYNG